MLRIVFAVSAVALGVCAAVAQEDPIAARRALMKANGDQAKIAGDMVKGAVPFDMAAAHKIFATFQNAAAKMPGLFPDTSKTGGDTAADPKIWDNMADFKAQISKSSAKMPRRPMLPSRISTVSRRPSAISAKTIAAAATRTTD